MSSLNLEINGLTGEYKNQYDVLKKWKVAVPAW